MNKEVKSKKGKIKKDMQLLKELAVQQGIDQELFAAIENNNPERVRELVELGADPNNWNETGDNALIIALKQKTVNRNVVKYLISESDVNSTGDSPSCATPLMKAAIIKPEDLSLEICKELINAGANPVCTSNEIGEECTAVDYAKDSQNFEVANYLLEEMGKCLFSEQTCKFYKVNIWEK